MTWLLSGALFGLVAGTAIALAALFGVWWERKVAGRMQMRFGPQQAGPAGILQTLADTVKLVLKEDVTPDAADPRIFVGRAPEQVEEFLAAEVDPLLAAHAAALADAPIEVED